MTSGSSPRIDQFFASKKKTPASSSSLRSGRVERDSKVTVAGSPSAKGSLDSYLVTSQDEKSPSKSLFAACNSTTRQGPPKRNLTLEIDLSSKHETTETLSKAQERPQVFRRDKSEVQADNDKAVVESPGNNSLDAVHVVENHKLNEFAAQFLPLYCRELITTVTLPQDSNLNTHKRQCSPSTLGLEDKLSKKRHFIDGEMTCSTEEPVKQLHADDVIRHGKANSDYSPEVTVHKDLVQPQASLRKCNLSTMNVMGCDTPVPFSANFGAHQTPKSIHGSSKSSPGEAFWNEAIQIADGLFDRNDNPCEQAAEEVKVDDSLYKKKSLNNISNDVPDIKEGEMSYEVASRDCNIGMVSALPSLGKKAKDLNMEVSPLPVKHFNFSLEDNYMGEVTPYQLFANNMGSLVPIDGQQMECTSVNKKALKTAHTSTLCNRAHGDGRLLGETTSSCALRKVDLLRQSDGMKANTPERNAINFATNFQYSEESTPSSFMLSKDHLDLSFWLPSELCSLYKKKGISKLYQWQFRCMSN